MQEEAGKEEGGQSPYGSLPLRLAALFDRLQGGEGDAKALQAQTLVVLAEVNTLVQEHTAQGARLAGILDETFKMLEFETFVERQVRRYLPLTEVSGSTPEEVRTQNVERVANAVEKMRIRHDAIEKALAPLAELSVPEDYIPDYFIDPDFGLDNESESTDFFVKRMDIRRAREALGTYPVPDGYPFKEKS